MIGFKGEWVIGIAENPQYGLRAGVAGRSERDAARVSLGQDDANSFRWNLALSTRRALCRISRGAADTGDANNTAAKDARVLASAGVMTMLFPRGVGLGCWGLAGLVTIEV